MRRVLLLGTCLTILMPSSREAEASPIELRISRAVFPLANYGVERVFRLADSSRGGSISMVTAAFSRPDPNHNYPSPPPTYPLNQGFGFLVGQDDGKGGFLGPYLSISGPTTGSYSGPGGMPPGYSGWYEGQATSAEVRYGSPEDLPLLLRDWLAHPEHLRISGSIGGGISNILTTTVSFDAPTVPEPATWAAWSLVGAGALLVRHRRLRVRG